MLDVAEQIGRGISSILATQGKNLARYLTGAPLADRAEQQLIDDLERARGNVAGFNRVLMFKRLSSSGPAFLLTLRRHLLRDRVYLHAVESGLPIPIGQVDQTVWDPAAGSKNDGLFDGSDFGLSPEVAYQQLGAKPPKKLRWLGPQHVDEGLPEDLRHDIGSIEEMLGRFADWDQAADGKIKMLADLVLNRHSTEKVLVFTEYRDTADYIVSALRERGARDLAVVSGQDGDATHLARRFSPGAHPIGLPPGKREIRVLISTDVLSEGQNLKMPGWW